MADKVIRTIIGYSLDKQSIVTIVQGAGQVNTVLQKTIGLTEELRTVDQRPLVGLIKYARDTGILKDEAVAAKEAIKNEREEVEQLDTAIKQTTESTEGLTRASGRARDALGRFLPKGSVGVIPGGGGGGLIPPIGGGDTPGGGGGGGGKKPISNGDAIRLVGSQLRGLPSVQIPGLGIGTDAIANIIRMAGALNEAAQAIPGVTAATTLLTPAMGATAAAFTAMLLPVAAVGVAIAPLLIALKVLADREAAAAKSAKELADIYAEEADAFAVGRRALQDRNAETKKEAVDLFNALNESFRTNAEKIRFLNDKKAQSDDKTAAEIQKTIDATINEQTKLSGSIDILRGDLEELGVQIDGFAPGLSKVGEPSKLFANILEKITGFAEGAQKKLGPVLEKLQEINEEANKRAEAEVKVVDKLNKDLVSIDQKAATDRAAIGVRLADTLIGINEKALEDAEKIAKDLQKQQESSRIKLERDQENAEEKKNFDNLNRIINFNRDEITARKKLDVELRRLREDAAAQEFEDGLDRNFAAIAASRRNVAREIARSNEDAQLESDNRLQSFKDKNDDQARQFAFETEQRQQNYKQQNDDAIQAANEALRENEANRVRARALARVQADQDYIDLQNKITQERNLKIQAAIEELKLVNQTEAEKQQAFLASWQQAQNLLKGITEFAGAARPANLGGNIGGKAAPLAFKALGGSLGQGQGAIVNEPWSRGGEGFSNSRGAIDFPGYGAFFPYTSGQVTTQNNRSVNLSMPIYIEGVQVDAVMAKVGQLADDRIAYTLERLNQRTP